MVALLFKYSPCFPWRTHAASLLEGIERCNFCHLWRQDKDGISEQRDRVVSASVQHKQTYRKIPIIIPGLIFVQKAF